jgi:osmoprotectant transport system ATP-binding protein
MNAAIEFRDVCFATAEGRLLLDTISLAVEEGTTTAVLGRSGSGKTTLLRTVNRMVAPTGGEVLVDGRSVRNADLIRLRRSVGYVIQETGLFPHMTAERDVGLVLEAQGRPRAERVRRSHELLAAVGLDPKQFARRALAAEPSVLLMDEPFGALDPLTRAEMQDMLRGLLASLEKTVLLVTHDLDEALYLGDRIVLLSEGKLVANLEPQEFLRSREPQIEAYVRAFHRGKQSAASGPVEEKRA